MLGDNTEKQFEQFMFGEFDIRIKFCEEVITNGSVERDEEGGRHDLIFYIHDDDIERMAVIRLTYGIKWWEDVVSYNNGEYLYNQEILDRYPVSW